MSEQGQTGTEQSNSYLVQLVKREIEVKKVKRGAGPVIELKLAPHERVVQITQLFTFDWASRSTVDYFFDVWVEARLDAPKDRERVRSRERREKGRRS